MKKEDKNTSDLAANNTADRITVSLHQAELALIEFIRQLGYGEINLKIQNGLPVTSTQIMKSKKFI